MSVLSSFRSNNYQQLEILLTRINCFEIQLLAWIKEGVELIKIKAKWAKPLVRKAGRVLSRILGKNLDEKAFVETLKEVAQKLNRIYHRCIKCSKAVADAAQKLYEQAINMLPKNTAVQLELLGEGDYIFNQKPTQKPMLKVVQKFFDKVGEQVAPKKSKSKVQPKGQQLELELGL